MGWRRAAVALLVSFYPLLAQTGPAVGQSGCGQADSTLVMYIRPYFENEGEHQAFRAAWGITPIGASDTVEVVKATSSCEDVADATKGRLNGQPIRQDIDEHGWTYTIIRIGQYYVNVFRVNSDRDGKIAALSSMYFFTGSIGDLEYRGSVVF